LSPHRRFDHRHVIAATPLLWAPSRCFSTLPSGHCHLVVPAPMLFWLPSCCSTHICCLDHRRGAFRRDHALYTISDPVVDGAFWFYAFFFKKYNREYVASSDLFDWSSGGAQWKSMPFLQ
jgi:hypothetical protein